MAWTANNTSSQLLANELSSLGESLTLQALKAATRWPMVSLPSGAAGAKKSIRKTLMATKLRRGHL